MTVGSPSSAHLHIKCPSTFTGQEGYETVFTIVQIRIFQGISRQAVDRILAPAVDFAAL